MNILDLFSRSEDTELERPFIMNKLEEAYSSRGYSGFCLYGQRQVGKSFLLRKFIINKPAIYYQATKQTEREVIGSLRLLTNNFVDSYIKEGETYAKFKELLSKCENIGDILQVIFALSTVEPMVFILDEIPYLLAAIPTLDSILQSIIDTVRLSSRFNIIFIICGSSLGVMNSVRDKSSPLFERLKSIAVSPFTFWESLPLLRKYSHEDAFKVYSIVGGYPGYLVDASKYETFDDFLVNTLLEPYGDLRASARDYLVSEGFKAYKAQAIINAIASGATKENEIRQRAQLPIDEFKEAFQALFDAGVIAKRTPVMSKHLAESKSYYINLPLFSFWSTFFRDIGDMPERVTIARETVRDSDLSTYQGHCFEGVCRDYLLRQAGDLACVSGFWGDKVLDETTTPPKSTFEELDICVALPNKLLLGECKWQNQQVDKSVADTLIRRSAYVDSALPRELFLFSRSGFTDHVYDLAAKNETLHLISFEAMFSSDTGNTEFFGRP